MADDPRTYRRAELYEQIWAEPLGVIAERYGVSDVALAKACRRLAVPLPGRGYWARRKAGQDLPRPPLRSLPGGRRDGLPVRRVRQEIPASVEDLVARERRSGASVVVPEVLDQPHELVAAASKVLGHAKPVDGLVSCWNKRCLNVVVSPASLDRALRIMDALLKALEVRGMRVEVTNAPEPNAYGIRRPHGEGLPRHDTRVLVGDVWVSFAIAEQRTRHDPAPGPEKNRSPWWSARAGTMVPNGLLALSLLNREWPAGRHTWQDGKRQRVEVCLNAFIAQLHIRAAALRKGLAERARWEQERLEEERRRVAAERQRWEDEERAKKLGDAIARWRLARDIREYAAETRGLVADAKLHILEGSWLDSDLRWAEQYADRIDPCSPVRADIEASRSAKIDTPSKTPGK